MTRELTRKEMGRIQTKLTGYSKPKISLPKETETLVATQARKPPRAARLSARRKKEANEEEHAQRGNEEVVAPLNQIHEVPFA